MLALLGVVATAAVLLAFPMPGPGPDDGEPQSPLALALASEFRASGNDGIQCATCHYGFLRGFEVEALLARGPGTATYEVALTPVAAYELAVAWAAPRSQGDGLPEPFAMELTVQVPPGGGAVRVPFALPWPAAVLVAEAWVPLEPQPAEAAPVLDQLPAGPPHPRPPLLLSLEGPAPSVSDLGSVPNRHAVALAERDVPLEGPWEVVLTALDPADAGRTLHVALRAVPVGYEVRFDDGSSTGTRGQVHRFRWDLPAPGGAGAPERFHVGVIAFNDHPTDRWTLPSAGDRGYYEGNVSAAQALQQPAPFTAADIEAAWEGRDAVVLHEHTFEGVRTRTRDERGERVGFSLRSDGQADVDVPVFPPMPPGTEQVRVTLEWQFRSPASPPVNWTVGVTQRPDPTFRYPPPTVAEPGRLHYLLQVSPEEWEREGDGWLQVWPILELGEGDRAVFDGSYSFRVEALRRP